ncbi:MAG: hypothetical protein IT338_08955 [Thermomicrobiales bacterium]|nr:hypothetical protein [Thermomicrobiales bacterium]
MAPGGDKGGRGVPRADPTRDASRQVKRAAWKAAPLFLTAALALLGVADVVRLPPISGPIRLLIILIVLAVGVGLSSALDRQASRPYWQMALFSTLILLPIVALQASASRVPFVALTRGSAGPLLWLTVATSLALIGLWLFAALQSGHEPEQGGILFLPAALLVPAMLGAPSSLDEASALTMLAEAFLVGGIAVFAGLLSPPKWKPLAGAFAIGAQFLLLWVLGRGPVIGQESGFVVPALAIALLALTLLLAVLAPLAALVVQRFFQTVERETGGRGPARAPARGARRSTDP